MSDNLALRWSSECHQPHPSHIEASHTRSCQHQHSRDEHQWLLFQTGFPSLSDDAFFGPEAADEWDTYDGHRSEHHSRGCDRHPSSKAPHDAHILRVEVTVVVTFVRTVFLTELAHVIVRVMHLVDD